MGYVVKRTVRLGYVPRRRPSGERGSILLVGPAWAAVRRAGLDPMRPIPGPRTGPSSFLGKKPWKKPDYAFQYQAPGGLAQGSCLQHSQSARQVLPFLTKNLSAVTAPGSSTSFCQSVGQRFRLGLGCRAKRTARFDGKGFRLLVGCQSLRRASDSLVGAPGREASILTEQARADRDHAPRFLGSGNAGKARQRIQYPAPANDRARVLGRSRPNR